MSENKSSIDVKLDSVQADPGIEARADIEITRGNDKETEDAKAEPPAPPAPPERSYRDPECAELARHRPNCDCAGEMRKPINPQ